MNPSLIAAMIALCSASQAQNLLTGGAGAWAAKSPVWSVDSTVQFGNASTLRYRNTDSNLYVLATRTIPAKPQTAYSYTASVKTNGIAGPDTSGATIALEWHDSSGKFLGGYYPKGVSGTVDWTKIGGTTALSPSNVATLIAICYSRKGCTGSAWFSDFDLHEAPPEPWSVTVLDPPYRGVIDATRNVQLDIRLPSNAALNGTIVSKLGDVSETHAANQSRLKFSVSVQGVHDGKNTLTVEWRDASGKAQGTYNEDLSYKEPHSKIMKFAGAVLSFDGRPFYPIGIYDNQGWVAGQTPARLDDIASAGFTCVLPYGLLSGKLSDVKNYLDAANMAGLKVIFSVKDLYDWAQFKITHFDMWNTQADILKGVVSTFRPHPALLAWYVNDEGGPDKYTSLKANYDTIVALDPDHPCLCVSNQPESVYRFVRTADVLGVDPYPVPNSALTLVSDWVANAEATNRPVWSAIQIFNKSDYQPGTTYRGPTPEEMRAMTFLAVATGADGLLMYSYYNLKQHPDFATNWTAIAGITTDLKKLLPAVTLGVSTPPKISGVVTRTWRTAGKLYLLAINPGTSEADCSVAVAGATNPTLLFGANRLSQVSTNMKGKLTPLDVEVYVLDVKP